MVWTPRWTDSFAANVLSDRWVGGHLNAEPDCTISVGNGLVFAFAASAKYASAAVVTREPVVGDFDACVRFRVQNPTQGTTFELAAITVDPPRSSALDNATATDDTRSRCYDVHGVPPYVSSEFDENDGWRIGWNRSSAQSRAFLDEEDGKLKTVSDNHFNRYGKDSGPKPAGPAEGWLRLVREGDTWRSFRLDDTETWQPTGVVLHMNMPRAVFLRLAAKHWKKTRAGLQQAPENRIEFHDFALY